MGVCQGETNFLFLVYLVHLFFFIQYNLVYGLCSFQEKYIIPEEAKPWVLKMMNDQFKSYKSRIKRDYYYPYPTDEERLENRPKEVPLADWKLLLKYWADGKTKVIILNLMVHCAMKYRSPFYYRWFIMMFPFNIENCSKEHSSTPKDNRDTHNWADKFCPNYQQAGNTYFKLFSVNIAYL